MDVDSVDLGEDFVKTIEETVESCDVLIAVIGERWLISSDEEGRRRLDNPEDFVRIEIATALKRDIRVIPVLVDGAKMPRTGNLPNDLQSLVRRQALEVSHNRFRDDSERLICAVERALAKSTSERRESEASAKRKLSQYDAFQALLESNSDEETMLRWLESDQENTLILSRTFTSPPFGNAIIAGFKFGTDYRADFVVFAPYSGGFGIHFVEIESPNDPLYTKEGVPAQRLAGALKRIQNWKVFVETEQLTVIRELDEAAKKRELVWGTPRSDIRENGGWPLSYPKASLAFNYNIVIGRRMNLSSEDLRRKASARHSIGVNIVTFDRLLQNTIWG